MLGVAEWPWDALEPVFLVVKAVGCMYLSRSLPPMLMIVEKHYPPAVGL